LLHDTITPDVETSSDGYALRFRGPVGEWFLETQRRAVGRLLAPVAAGPLSVLEVGGGHGQLAGSLAGSGHRLVVHASRPGCHGRLLQERDRQPARLQLVSSSLFGLPFADGSFDLVLAVRLMAHVERWKDLLAEMARVSRRFLIVDYPPVASLNILTPALFGVKRRIEGNTRPYFMYLTGDIRRHLESLGYETMAVTRQFAIPMGLHRVLGRAGMSRRVEGFLEGAGLTRLIGSPALLVARRR